MHYSKALMDRIYAASKEAGSSEVGEYERAFSLSTAEDLVDQLAKIERDPITAVTRMEETFTANANRFRDADGTLTEEGQGWADAAEIVKVFRAENS